jgi:hypothetical protein
MVVGLGTVVSYVQRQHCKKLLRQRRKRITTPWVGRLVRFENKKYSTTWINALLY